MFSHSLRTLRSILVSALALLGASQSGLAQLDPRLQSVRTDLLDVYKINSAKPELLTVYDFSNSMHAVYWDSRYYSNAGQNSHSPAWSSSPGGGDLPGLSPCFDENGYIWMLPALGSVDGQGRGDIRGTTQPSEFQTSGGYPTAELVRPDGTTVAISHSRSYTQAQLTAFVLQASHLRVTATATVSSTSVTRTVDLPLPWAVFRSASATSASNIKVQITDPAGGPAMYPDTLFNHQTNGDNNIVNDPDEDTGLYSKIGRLHYNKDFLWWIFFGMDVRNATNDGVTATTTFVIPAVDTNVTSLEPSGYPAKAWGNTLCVTTSLGTGAMTRFQALKYATLVAWFANQSKVWWGVRFLDDAEELKTTVEANNGNASSPAVDRNINLFRSAQNGNVNSMLEKFVDFQPRGSTPLTYAMANAYTQLSLTVDASSTFGTSQGGGQSGTESPISPCRKSFVVVFTDGIANDGYTDNSDYSAIGRWDPYGKNSSGVSTNTAATGNAAVNGYGLSTLSPSYAKDNFGNGLFNLPTLAGLAAHYPKPGTWVGPSSVSDSYSLTGRVPFLVTSRGAKPGSPRRIRTMSVGMSLSGALSETGSGKFLLYKAALYGNPDQDSWSPLEAPFDPNDPNADPAVNPFFFDATDPGKLSSAMTAVLAEVTSGSAAIAAPASPLVGLSLGNQVYLGLFQTAKGPRWRGDLLMAGLLLSPEGVSFLGDDGATDTNSINITPVVDVTDRNALWSANRNVFNNLSRTWGGSNKRKIYTHLPGSSDLIEFDEGTASLTDSVLGIDVASKDPAVSNRANLIRFIRGARDQAFTDPSDYTPRLDIMADIVNSSPAVLEYPISALTSSVSSKLSAWLATVPKEATPRFRVILVGSNQGMFHAFGEVSYVLSRNLTINGKQVKTLVPYGEVDELWAFIPGEFLKHLTQLRSKSRPHLYSVDGSPVVYFKDIPASNQATGNGVVDTTDKVRVVMGLRKGGRSYYAFDFSDLSKVVTGASGALAWRLVPDEYSKTTTDSQQKVLSRMGFSTSLPAIARVKQTSGTSTVARDMLFFGGGMSTDEVDAKFVADGYPAGTKLGRSIVAFDVVNGPGTSLYTWDFSSADFTTKFGAMGAVANALAPMEFFPGSGMAQRIYFSDTPTAPNATATRGGGVWALGNTGLSSNGVTRLDSSTIDAWTSNNTASTVQGIRKIYQAAKGFSITTTPGAFRLADPYPVRRTEDPKISPVAVGITFGTGDRNDPMDNDDINPATATARDTTPHNNWLNVVFDRQDSASISGLSGITSGTKIDETGLAGGVASNDGQLADLTTVNSFTDDSSYGYSVDPLKTTYYLKKFPGYKLNMGAATAKTTAGTEHFYPKVITNSLVLNGVLFFSRFTPQSSAQECAGAGITHTFRICNVLQPTFNSGGNSASSSTFNSGEVACSGIVLSFPNLPGEITALGTSTMIQSGQGNDPTSPGTISNSGAQLGGAFGKNAGSAYRPKAWRIIR